MLMYVAVGLVALLVVGFCVQKIVSNYMADSMYESLTGESMGSADDAGSIVESDTVDVQVPGVPLDFRTTANDDFVAQEYGLQLNDTIPYLESKRDEAFAEISTRLEAENFMSMIDPASVADPSQRRVQEILNNETADVWTISKEANPIAAKNLLSAVYKPGTAGHDAMTDEGRDGAIGAGSGLILSYMTAFESSKVFTQGSFGYGIETMGQPMQVAVIGDILTARVYQNVFIEYRSQDGRSSNNVIVGTFQYDETGRNGFIDDPTNWTPSAGN